jgi:hypothetical protein
MLMLIASFVLIRAQFRSAVVKRRFEAGDFAAPASSIAPSPCLPIAGAIHFPDISAIHLARIFDFCRTEWPSDRADASWRHALSKESKYHRIYHLTVHFLKQVFSIFSQYLQNSREYAI